MKRKVKIACIQVAVFAVVWLGVEFMLQEIGVKTLYEIERNAMDGRFLGICRRVQKEKLVVYNAFLTDGDAIFKANPAFDFNALFPGNGCYAINDQGFRGNHFQRENSGKTKVLLVGDSFVWGYAARPIQASFADLLQDAGYYVYNGGIPGTDPRQYLKIVKKYAPLLKPQVVVVCLFMGNDFRANAHPVQANKNLHYLTNFGYLLGYDNLNGMYFRDAGESFLFLKKRYCGCYSNPREFFLYHTILGRLVCTVFSSKSKMPKSDTEGRWIADSLRQMRRICRQCGSAFMVFLIPTAKSAERAADFVKSRAAIFAELPWFYPESLKASDYTPPPDGHFNNRGHRKFADFLIHTMKEHGHAAAPKTMSH